MRVNSPFMGASKTNLYTVVTLFIIMRNAFMLREEQPMKKSSIKKDDHVRLWSRK